VLSSGRKRTLLLGGAAAVALLQIALLYYFGGSYLLSDQPMGGLDHDTHVSQTWRVLEGLESEGRSWVYDVHHLAGVPTGVIFDADNKGWELFTYAFERLGLSRGQSYNLFIIAAHLLVGPVLYASSRLFGLGRGGALFAALAGVLYWNYDSWSHWVWYVGMTSYGMASYLALLPLAAFYAWLRRRRSWMLWVGGISLALCHLVHPYTFFILVVPMLVLYVRGFRTLGGREHAAVVAVAVVTIAANAYWLHNAIQFWHYILDSSLFASTGLSTAVWDALGLVVEPGATGIIAKRTAFRTTLLVTAGVGLWGWWRRGDPRFAPFAALLGVLVGVAYLGGYTFLAQTQPYRNLLPAGFVAAIVAGAVVERGVARRVFRRASRSMRTFALVLAVPATLFLVRDITYFSPTKLPIPSKLPHGERVLMGSFGHVPDPFYTYADWYAEGLAQWVTEHDDGSGRFLVEGWAWGEQLTYSTDAQILGGFIWRNLQHSWANFFRRRPQGIAKPDELRQYLHTYAAHWVIISTAREVSPWWDHSPLLTHVADVDGFRIYAVKDPTGFIAKGPGQVSATTNRIEVTGTDPDQPVVLRYHWLETLRCEPSCSIEQKRIRLDPVGFIRVPAPHPPDFVIVNRYR
jgi:hypothetical protein